MLILNLQRVASFFALKDDYSKNIGQFLNSLNININVISNII